MITVFGATGHIGQHLVPDLLARGESVRAVTRQGDGARPLLDPEGTAGSRLEMVALDLSAPDAAARATAVIDGATAVFLALPGTPEQPAQERIVVDAMVAADIRRLTKISVIGAVHDNAVVYGRWHAGIEDRIAELGLDATILRPGWFAENFVGSAPTIVSDGTVYGSAGNGSVSFVDSRDTAAVAAVTLTDPAYAGRELTVTGPEAITFTQAAARLAEGLDREVGYVDLTDEQFRGALIGAGLPDDVADIVVSINVNARNGNLAVVTDTVQELTGKPARSLAQWAADNRSAFAPG